MNNIIKQLVEAYVEMNNTNSIITGGIQIPKTTSNILSGQVSGVGSVTSSQPQQTNKSNLFNQPSRGKIEKTNDTVGAAPVITTITQEPKPEPEQQSEPQSEQQPVQQLLNLNTKSEPEPKTASQKSQKTGYYQYPHPKAGMPIDTKDKSEPALKYLPPLDKNIVNYSPPRPKPQHLLPKEAYENFQFNPGQLKKLIAEQTVGGGSSPGIQKPKPISTNKDLNKNNTNYDINQTTGYEDPAVTMGKELGDFLSKHRKEGKELFKKAVVNIGPYIATPPSVMAASAIGRIGQLGFDAANQEEYSKHLKSIIDPITLKGLTDKIPILGKYAEAGRQQLTDLAVAMYLDPRALGRRTKYISSPSTQTTKSPQKTNKSEESETSDTPKESKTPDIPTKSKKPSVLATSKK